MEQFCAEVHIITQIRHLLSLEEREELGCKMIKKNPEMAKQAAQVMKACVMEQIGRIEGLTEQEVLEALFPAKSMDGCTQTVSGSLDGST